MNEMIAFRVPARLPSNSGPTASVPNRSAFLVVIQWSTYLQPVKLFADEVVRVCFSKLRAPLEEPKVQTFSGRDM